jgi:hypothetical protein
MMLAPFPLPRAAQDAAKTAPSVATRLLPAFVAALAGRALAEWATRRRALPRLRTRARRRWLMLAGSLLTMLAVLPSVFAYDHVLPHDTHADERAAVHASHCHDGPGSCADAPVTSGPGQMLDAAPLVVAPAMLSILLLAITPILIGVTRRPYLRPPLPLVAASI